MKPRLDIRFPLRNQYAFFHGKPYVVGNNEFLLNHARSGILLALKALDFPTGSLVGVLAYNCYTVFNAVAQAGCIPVFIDVTERLTMDLDDLQVKKEGLSALVVTHLFGIKNDIDSIKELCPGLPIIEDCAHAFGIQNLKGDFAVFSVGQGKLPTLGDGGILQVLSEDYLEVTKRLYQNLPDYSWGASLKLFVKLLITAICYTPVFYSMVTLAVKRKRSASSGQETINLKKMSRGVSALFEKNRTTSLESIESRTRNAETLIKSLQSDYPDCSFFYGLNAFMLIARSDRISDLKDYLKKKKIESETHFAHCIDWATGFGYRAGLCPQAEYLTGHLLMIPTYE